MKILNNYQKLLNNYQNVFVKNNLIWTIFLLLVVGTFTVFKRIKSKATIYDFFIYIFVSEVMISTVHTAIIDLQGSKK